MLLWIWQFPQNIVGIIAVKLLLAYKPITQDLTDFYVHYNTWFSSVSLGNYIIVNGYDYTEKNNPARKRTPEAIPLSRVVLSFRNRLAFCNRQFVAPNI